MIFTSIFQPNPTFASVTVSGLTPAGFVKNSVAGLLSTEAPGTSTYIPYSSGTGFSYSANLTFTNNATPTLSELLSAGNVSVGAFIKISTTTSSIGIIKQNDVVLFHTYYPKNQATTGRNVFIGETAGNFTMNNTAISAYATGNVGIGRSCLASLTTGFFNMAIGTDAGTAITSGDSNVLIGYGAGLRINTASNNMLFGRNAGVFLTDGGANVAIGNYALDACGSGANNVAIGYSALGAATSSSSIGIGVFAGLGLVGNGNGIFLGNFAGRYETASNTLMIDGLDRTDLATGRTNSIIYGVMNSTVSSQTLALNAVTSISQTLGVTGLSTLTGGAAVSDLTAGRITFAGASGRLVDDADLTFAADTLTATKISTGLILPTTGQTTVNGLTGTADWSMPFQGSSYKKFLVYLTNFTSAGSVITFPTSFSKTPTVYGDASAIAIAVTTTTTTTLTSVGAVAGFIIIEGY
jgi:hypothetical protein